MKECEVKFELNGSQANIKCHPMTRLLDALRLDCKRTGTKEGCGEGECGACSVILDGQVVMSCMVPAVQVEGRKVETIEGVMAEYGDKLHPLQETFVECGGAQCGICTPGMIMSAVAWLRNPDSAPGGVAEALEGNLCRCTGYMRIFEAVKLAQERVGG